jgi:hypothetical protein
MKQILGLLAVVIAFVGYTPYLRDTIIGKTKPHIFSWFLWSLISFIAFGLQWSKGAGAGSYANFAMGLICSVLFIFSFRNGTKNIKRADIISLILAVIATILWLVVNQPVWSIILVVIIDIFSFTPTFIKSWDRPYEETLSTWFLNIVRQIFILLSIVEINFVTITVPLYALVANIAFFILLITRRKIKTN